MRDVRLVPFYSSDWGSAGQVIEKMRELGWHFRLRDVDGTWEAVFWRDAYWEGNIGLSKSGPDAICLAAIAALNVRYEP